MNKQQNINLEKGLASKIYGLAFKKPCSGYELAEIIGTQSHHVNSKIKIMYELGYLDKIDNEKWRWPKWQSNSQPLIDKIIQVKKDEDVTFSDIDIKIFEDKLNSSLFRNISSNTYKHELKKGENMNSIDSILTTFEMFLMLISQFDFYLERCEKVIDEKSYKDQLEEIKQSYKDLYIKLQIKFVANSFDENQIELILNNILTKKVSEEKKTGIKNLILKYKNTKHIPHKNSKKYKNMMKIIKDITSSDDKLLDYINFVFLCPVSKHIQMNFLGISSWGRKYKEMSKSFEMILSFRFLNYLY